MNGSESPLKVKHARVAIIGTFQSNGGRSFWAVAIRQPLQVRIFFPMSCNRITYRNESLMRPHFILNIKKIGKSHNCLEILSSVAQIATWRTSGMLPGFYATSAHVIGIRKIMGMCWISSMNISWVFEILYGLIRLVGPFKWRIWQLHSNVRQTIGQQARISRS